MRDLIPVMKEIVSCLDDAVKEVTCRPFEEALTLTPKYGFFDVDDVRALAKIAEAAGLRVQFEGKATMYVPEPEEAEEEVTED